MSSIELKPKPEEWFWLMTQLFFANGCLFEKYEASVRMWLVKVCSWAVIVFSEYYREETARLVQQLGDSRVQVATLEAQIEFLTNKVEEQETVDSLYIRRSDSHRYS